VRVERSQIKNQVKPAVADDKERRRDKEKEKEKGRG
jgi:hypothetical protein